MGGSTAALFSSLSMINSCIVCTVAVLYLLALCARTSLYHWTWKPAVFHFVSLLRASPNDLEYWWRSDSDFGLLQLNA